MHTLLLLFPFGFNEQNKASAILMPKMASNAHHAMLHSGNRIPPWQQPRPLNRNQPNKQTWGNPQTLAITQEQSGPLPHTCTHRQEAWGDPPLLVVAGSVAGQLQHLSTQVLQHSGQVNGGTLAHPLGIPPGPDERGCAAHREGQPGLLGLARPTGLAFLGASLGSLLVLASLGGWAG